MSQQRRPIRDSAKARREARQATSASISASMGGGRLSAAYDGEMSDMVLDGLHGASSARPPEARDVIGSCGAHRNTSDKIGTRRRCLRPFALADTNTDVTTPPKACDGCGLASRAVATIACASSSSSKTAAIATTT